MNAIKIFSIISSKNSGTYLWLSLLFLCKIVNILKKKLNHLDYETMEILDRQSSFSQATLTLTPISKFSSYSLKTRPVKIIAVKILTFFI